ncbi:MAG: SDR family NAD(P)-dependent oxidoreductase, partial [Acinetobacter sp.]
MTQSHTALITGGGQGLGRATALEMAANGINVLITDLNE